jgi:DNA invertase Pin-like site-specific DNA recombinase
MTLIYGYTVAAYTDRIGNKGGKQRGVPYHLRLLLDRYHRDLGIPKPYNWNGVFVDGWFDMKVKMGMRPAGLELSKRLLPGDILVIANVERVFLNLEDMMARIRYMDERQKIRIILADYNMDLGTKGGRFMLRILRRLAKFTSIRNKEFKLPTIV